MINGNLKNPQKVFHNNNNIGKLRYKIMSKNYFIAFQNVLMKDLNITKQMQQKAIDEALIQGRFIPNVIENATQNHEYNNKFKAIRKYFNLDTKEIAGLMKVPRSYTDAWNRPPNSRRGGTKGEAQS